MTKRFTYFNEQNQKFEILPGAKRELREIAKTLGMSGEELAKMALGSSELADKMGKIRFPKLETGNLTEDQQQMIANLSEMKDGKYMIQVERRDKKGRGLGEFDFKDIETLKQKDIDSLLQQNKDSTKTLEETAQDQLTVQKRSFNQLETIASSVRGGLASSRIIREGAETLTSEADKLAETLTSKLTSKKVRESADELTPLLADFGKTMIDLFKGEISQEDAENKGNALDKFFKDKFGVGMETLDELFEKAKTGYDEIIETVANSTNPTASNTNPSIMTSSNQTVNPTDVLQRSGDQFQILQNVVDYGNLNNLNNQPQSEVIHRHDDMNFKITIDAPAGMDSAALTEVVTKMLKDPNVVANFMSKQQQMQNNYGVTGGNVGSYSSTAN
jgi:hypothetical protein